MPRAGRRAGIVDGRQPASLDRRTLLAAELPLDWQQLYGNGSPGGLVNAISKRPTQTPFAEVELEGGSYNRYAGKFDLGGPIGADGQLAYV